MDKQEIMLELITVKKLLEILSNKRFKTVSDLKKFEKKVNFLLDRMLELEKILSEFNK